MIRFKIKLLIAFVLCSQISFGQLPDQNVANQLLTATWQIDFIRTNGLLIRLRTYDRTIAHFSQNGSESAITKLQESEQKLNKEILSAFGKYFTFCPIYYFYSRDIDSLRNGNFTNVFNLDGTTANYTDPDFFVIDPYYAFIKNMNHSSTGFSLLTKKGELVNQPFPNTIIKRFGPFYKTYDQLVFDWNYRFEEMAFIRSDMQWGILKDKIKDPNNQYSNAEEREINRLENQLRKRFKKSYPMDKRPKRSNSGY